MWFISVTRANFKERRKKSRGTKQERMTCIRSNTVLNQFELFWANFSYPQVAK